MNDTRIGDKIKKNLAAEVSSQLKNLLPSDEKIVGIFNATAIKPLIEAVVVTNARTLCLVKEFPDGWKYVKELHRSDIKSLSAKRTKLSNFIYTPLKVRTKDDKEHKYADVRKDEADEIVKLIGGISGSPERLSSILEKRREVVKHNEKHEAQEQTAVKQKESTSEELNSPEVWTSGEEPRNNNYQSTCPRCGSDNLQAVQQTRTRGVDATASTAGCCCLGPLGLLCGLPGAGASHSTVMRVCLNCGKKFK